MNQVLSTALGAAIGALAIGAPLAVQAEPVFRGNAAHTGVYHGPGVPKFTQVKWKFQTKGKVISSPAVANGAAYVGSTDGHLYAVDVGSGQERWKFKTGARIVSSPAVGAGLVYFGSYDSNFYAVDAATGALKWKFETGGERRFAAKNLHGALPKAETMPDPFDFYLSSPALSGGMVYFGSGDGNVYALDAGTGTLKWKFQTQNVVHASPAIAQGTLFIGSWDSYFYALDAASGAEKWRFKTGEDPVISNQVGIQSSAAVADGMVFFGCRDSKFYALDAKTGEKRWTFDNKGSWVIASPAIKNGKVYFATSDTGLFHALDTRTGAAIFQLSLNRWPTFSSPAISGDMLYAGSHAGKLIAIDLKAQELAWEFQTEASRTVGPSVTSPDGTPNYAAAFVENFCDEIIGGVLKMMANGAMLSSPAVSGGVVYVGSNDGNLYAIE